MHVVLDATLRAQEYEMRQVPDALELGGGDINGVIYGLLDLPRLLLRMKAKATMAKSCTVLPISNKCSSMPQRRN